MGAMSSLEEQSRPGHRRPRRPCSVLTAARAWPGLAGLLVWRQTMEESGDFDVHCALAMQRQRGGREGGRRAATEGDETDYTRVAAVRPLPLAGSGRSTSVQVIVTM